MSLDHGTTKVVEMYSKYPFPFGGNHGGFFERYVLPAVTALAQEYPIRRVLDAGCGTGNVIVDIGTFVPEAAVVGIDLTDESLAHARQRAEKRGLKNISFQKSNLLQHDATLGKFDFVYSQGVIHHLSDPLEGLKNLNRYLRKDHHAFVWLYSLAGRRRLLDLREALNILGVDNLPWEERIQLAMDARPLFLSQRLTFARKLIKVLECYDKQGFKGVAREAIHRFQRPSGGSYAKVIVADQYLHPQDKFYRVAEAWELFAGANFEVVRILQGMSNTLEESFGDEKILRNRRLSRLDAYKLIELHEQPEGVGYLVKKTNEVSE